MGQTRSVGSKSYPLPVSIPALRHGPTDPVIQLLRGDGAYASYDAILKSQPLVYAAVTKLTNAVARNPLKVYEYGVDGDSRQRVRSHPLAQLLRRPHVRGSEFSVKAYAAQNLFVYGECLIVKVRPSAGAPPNELWTVPMRQVQVIKDESGVLGYEVYAGVSSLFVGPEDVIHIELPAGSPLQPLARTLALEDASITWQGENLANGMTQRGAFVTDARLNDATIPRLRAELEQLYGGVENAGKVALLEQGLKFESIGVSAVDSDLIAQRKLSREEVCAAYDINPALLGLEQANYGATVEHRRALFDAVSTRLNLIEQTIQAHLVDPEPSWDGLFVEFDTNEMLRPDPETRARTHMLMQQAGVSSANERRRAENLPAIDDPMADAIFVPVNMQPVGEGIDTAPATTQEAGTPMQGIGDQVVQAVTASATLDTFKE